MILYPELKRLGKKVVIASYSFGDTEEIKGEAPVVFEEQLPDEPKRTVQVKRVTAESVPNKHHAPEIHMCSFLDQKYPQDAPHSIYAFCARFFTEPLLRKFYGQLVNDHQVAILMMDGGSDSLVASDEDGLGDPIEDCVSITAVATLDDPRLHQNNKMLLVVGLGAWGLGRFHPESGCRAHTRVASWEASRWKLPLRAFNATRTACNTSTRDRAFARC